MTGVDGATGRPTTLPPLLDAALAGGRAYDIIVINAGINDLGRGNQSATVVMGNLVGMIQKAAGAARGAVVVIGPWANRFVARTSDNEAQRRSLLRMLDAYFRDPAAAAGAAHPKLLLDRIEAREFAFWDLPPAERDRLQDDMLHLTEAGYDALGAHVFATLLDSGVLADIKCGCVPGRAGWGGGAPAGGVRGGLGGRALLARGHGWPAGGGGVDLRWGGHWSQPSSERPLIASACCIPRAGRSLLCHALRAPGPPAAAGLCAAPRAPLPSCKRSRRLHPWTRRPRRMGPPCRWPRPPPPPLPPRPPRRLRGPPQPARLLPCWRDSCLALQRCRPAVSKHRPTPLPARQAAAGEASSPRFGGSTADLGHSGSRQPGEAGSPRAWGPAAACRGPSRPQEGRLIAADCILSCAVASKVLKRLQGDTDAPEARVPESVHIAAALRLPQFWIFHPGYHGRVVKAAVSRSAPARGMGSNPIGSIFVLRASAVPLDPRAH
jgi:lysophospholipase L1-like esterase